MPIKLVAPIEQVGAEDAVIYNPQTLTDEQKAQARENIGAEPLYGGLKKRIYAVKDVFGNDEERTIYISGDGDLVKPPENASEEIQLAFRNAINMMFLWTGSYSAAQKTSNYYYQLYKAGYLTLPAKFYSSLESPTNYIKVYLNNENFCFEAQDGNNFYRVYRNIETEDYSAYIRKDVIAETCYDYSTNPTNPVSTVSQFLMSKNPTEDMHVATKKYVDSVALPAVSTTDNGKILKVVDGVWAVADA